VQKLTDIAAYAERAIVQYIRELFWCMLGLLTVPSDCMWPTRRGHNYYICSHWQGSCVQRRLGFLV